MAKEANKNKERKDGGEAKRYSFSLSMSGLVSLVVVTLAALVWVFILGVLVGRGYKPEKAVPQLAEIMPRPGENATAEPPRDKVLKPEELEFFDKLKRKTQAETQPAPKAESKAVVETKPKAEARPETQPAPKVEAAPKAAEPMAPQATTDGQARFHYVYQVASLKDAKMAREYAARLEKLGLSVFIEEAQAAGATWHRIMVRHTGTPESTRQLKDVLKAQGVNKPIMKAKTPASN